MRRMLRRPWKGRLLCRVCMGLAARFTVPVMAVLHVPELFCRLWRYGSRL